MTKQQFENIYFQYERNQHICVIIDKSGSMSGGYLDLAKENATKLGLTFFSQKNTENVRISSVLFDNSIYSQEN